MYVFQNTTNFYGLKLNKENMNLTKEEILKNNLVTNGYQNILCISSIEGGDINGTKTQYIGIWDDEAEKESKDCHYLPSKNTDIATCYIVEFCF